MANQRMPVFFLSHGGGPWPYMKDQLNGKYDQLEASLQQLPATLPQRPKAILVISGHWEEQDFAIMSSPQPAMLYDYSGFPEHTYKVRYEAPGSPELALRVQTLLEVQGLPNHFDPNRGFDHGTFTPLVVIYPQADIPVVELSMQRSYDPAAHLALGRALEPLRDEGVLIIGSGLSYHNLRQFGAAARGPSQAFDQWLQQTVLHSTPLERVNRLIDWELAPAARQAHPREDHLIPLMVAVGAAEDGKATCIYHEDAFMGGVAVSSFRFD